ncbi:MAG: hypothetical protein IT363_02545 [Methanoregulaceae archaeon]|nr:hypothetical protein [Methanoregulaceae archaeon]
MKRKTLITLLVAAFAVPAFSQSTVDVRLGGTGSKTLKGTIKGRDYIDYRVNVGAGQTLAVSMTTRSTAAYFNITPPGTEWAMFNGSIEGNSASRRIPAGGRYTVRVYQMASAGRRGDNANFTLKLSVTGKSLSPIPGAQDAVIPGTKFHASTEMPVKVEGSSNPQNCKAFVTRYRGGSATLEVHLPQERKLRLLFVGNSVVGWSSTDKPKASRKGEETSITVDGFSFTVVDALLYGG